jgi:transposase
LLKTLAAFSENARDRCDWSNGKPPFGASGIAELIAFVDGLADDAEAVVNGCSLNWSNGMVEGFVNKVKWIKRSSYGQAGFPLLQRRVLLHSHKSA